MNNINLSIIIPCYNASKFCDQLSECIENQLNGGGKIEFILIDDGSKDDTLSLINDIKTKYPENIQVISKNNGGVSSARNAGLEIAQGTWVGFLDSDDIFAPHGLQYLLENCVNENIDILQFESKSLSKVPVVFSELTANVTNELNGREFYLQTKSITVWRFLYRNDYIRRHHLRFRDLTIGEDTLFNFEAFMANGRICCVDTIVTYHIDREGSLTTSTNPAYVRKVVDSAIYMQKVYTEFLSHTNVSDEISQKITSHRKRNVLFVFQKIRVTPDYSIKEIKETASRFNQYATLSLCNASRQERFVRTLYNNPFVFKVYVHAYSLMKMVLNMVRKKI